MPDRPGDLQGLRHPRPARRAARRRRRRADRPRLRRASSPSLAGKAPGELRIGLGRDMRLTAPELAARYREGMVAEGAHVLDAGMVGTEMLYFLVGSRGLDGGLMCTASHNPKAYTGAKLVREGALAAQRRRGHPRHPPRRSRQGLGDADRRAAPSRTSTSAPTSSDAALRFIDPAKRGAAEGRRRRRQRHGRARWSARCSSASGSTSSTTYWEPDGDFPDHEPNPLLEENRRFIVDKVRETGRRPRDRLGRRRRPLLLHRRHRALRRRRLPDRDPRRAPAGQADPIPRPRGDPLRRPRLARRGRHRRARRRHRARQPRRPRVLQDAHARRGRDLRRRGLRPLLLPRLLQRRLGDDPGAARCSRSSRSRASG